MLVIVDDLDIGTGWKDSPDLGVARDMLVIVVVRLDALDSMALENVAEAGDFSRIPAMIFAPLVRLDERGLACVGVTVRSLRACEMWEERSCCGTAAAIDS